jgi:hypothetical protein
MLRGGDAGSPAGGQPRNLHRAKRALDAANFFLADVRDALGPYLAVYLLTERKWDEASIGVVMSIATVAGILAQTPAGALVDATQAKRGIMMAAAAIVTAASLVHMSQYDLVLQELHQRRIELLQLMDEFESGQQEDQSLAEAWRDELSRVEQEISEINEFEERNRQQQQPPPMGGSGMLSLIAMPSLLSYWRGRKCCAE